MKPTATIQKRLGTAGMMLMALSLLLAACGPKVSQPIATPPTQPPAPTTAPIPTTAPLPTTAPVPTTALLPTSTPLPTTTPLPTIAPLPTSAPPPTTAPVATKLPAPTYPPVQPTTPTGCVLVSQKPSANSVLAANKAYTFTWVIQNTGTIKWDQNEYDVIFVSSSSGSSTRAGSSVYNLPTTVMPGATVTLSVPFTTPGKAGSYTETWAIAQTKKEICSFKITIQVK